MYQMYRFLLKVGTQVQIAGNQQIVRGRRTLLAHITKGSSSQNLSEKMISTFSKIELEKKNVCPTITSAFKSAEASNLLVSQKQSQQQIVDIPAPKEEKSPITCRVSKNSDKDTYHMTQLSSNYIRVKLEEDKKIYEYRVDFYPPVDAKSARLFLVNEHRDIYPVKIFDGTLLYVPKMLPQNVTTLKGKLRDELEMTLTITFKRKHSLRDCIHFYNAFLHTIMRTLGLVQFGRSCHDHNKRILIPEFK